MRDKALQTAVHCSAVHPLAMLRREVLVQVARLGMLSRKEG